MIWDQYCFICGEETKWRWLDNEECDGLEINTILAVCTKCGGGILHNE